MVTGGRRSHIAYREHLGGRRRGGHHWHLLDRELNKRTLRNYVFQSLDECSLVGLATRSELDARRRW